MIKHSKLLPNRQNFIWHLMVIFILLASSGGIFAQGQQIAKTSSNNTQYWEYLPPEYNLDSTQTFPIIIFLHGAGERGSDLNKVLLHGPPKLINEGQWPASRPFIVLSPQLPSSYGGWFPQFIDRFFNSIEGTYKVDTNRIYLTGVSLGAMGTLDYANFNPGKLTAIVPISGKKSSTEGDCKIKDIAIWAFHNQGDPVFPVGNITATINRINACVPAPDPLAKLTVYNDTIHDAWTRTYDLSAGHDIYSWMLQYSKNDSTANQSPTANAGSDVTITLPQDSVTLSGSGNDPDGSITAYAWAQQAGPTTAALSGQNTATLSASDLSAGLYTFRLTVTDDSAATAYDDVNVSIIPSDTAVISWHSYNIVMQNETTQQGVLMSSDGNIQAVMEFYASTNNFGVNKGTLFSQYNSGNHANGNSHVATYWANGTGNTYPYAGKDVVARGSDTGEGNSPSPLGVYDLQLHPPNTDKLVVSAFIVPVDGEYTISDLGARRVSNLDATIRYRVFDQNKTQLLNLQATNNQDWVMSATPISLGALTAGDRIYFAVDREGHFGSDFTEVSWAVNLIQDEEPPTQNYEAGINYKYYQGFNDSLPNFSNMSPSKTGILNNFRIDTYLSQNNWGFSYQFEGIINIASAGNYTFYLNSDDGSKLYIDDVTLVDNNGKHGPTELSGTVNLPLGFHAIKVEYFESGGGEILEVKYAGPGISKTALPDSVLFHEVSNSSSSRETSLRFVKSNKDELDNSSSLFPNPVKNIVYLSSRFSGSKVMVYTLTGQKVMHSMIKENANPSLNLSHLKPGLYYLTVEKEGKKEQFKFIKE